MGPPSQALEGRHSSGNLGTGGGCPAETAIVLAHVGLGLALCGGWGRLEGLKPWGRGLRQGRGEGSWPQDLAVSHGGHEDRQAQRRLTIQQPGQAQENGQLPSTLGL